MELYKKSLDVILENQSAYGSFIACPTFPTYHFSWIRDSSFIAYALDVTGEYQSAEKFYNWLKCVIEKNEFKINALEKKITEGSALTKSDFLNARFTLDGNEEPDTGWGNFQLDAYGTWLWGFAEHVKKTGNFELITQFKKCIDLTVKYISNLWYYPNFDVWEENSDKIHTSTLACLYGGLNSISELINDDKINCLKNHIRSYILTNCVKNDRFVKYIGTDEVDASLLWLSIPFEVTDIDNPIYVNTVRKIEDDLLCNGGVHRYKTDTYYGGGEWILLSCWLGWYYAKTGNDEKAKKILQWVEGTADENGFLPEQDCKHMNDGTYYDEWENMWGKPAKPLLWSHAMYVILKNEVLE